MYTDAPSSQNFPGDGSSSQGPTLFVELVDAQGNALQAVPLNERGVTVGSAPGNVLLIDSPAVARFHVRINWDGQYASILNLATRKPTLFGGGPLQANELRFWQPGEILQIGDSRLRLQVGTVPVQQQHSSDAPVTMPLGALPALINDGHLDIQLDSGYDMVDLTPEQATIVKLTLINRGSTPETVTVGLEGPAAGWLRTPQAPIQIRPGAQIGHTLQIMVPRKPENRAGEYEVLIRMRSQTNTGLSVTTTGHWTVLPFSDAKLEVRPPILKVRSMNSGIYTVALRNLGNASMPFEIRISDDQQSLEFAPITASGVLEPGAIDERKIEVQPIREPDDKEQTYNVRVQAFANAQTYTDNASLIQKRAMFPPWVIPLAISAVVLLLVAGAALWTRQARANQNNQNATQVAAITQTVENMRLTDNERQATALAASTQTPLAMTLEAINSNGIMGPTATILSQINGTQIAAAAQITAQAAMIRTVQASGSNTTNNNNFFGGAGGAAPNDPRQATLDAALATAQAAADQVVSMQTAGAQQAGQAAQAGQTSQAVGQATQAAGNSQATQAAGNSQATQAAQQQQTTTANGQNTVVAQTAAAQTASAQTVVAQTASAVAAAQTQAAQQTSSAATNIAVQQTANANATSAAATSQAQAAIATQTAIAAPFEVRIIDSPSTVDAGAGFSVVVQLNMRSGQRSPISGVDVELRLFDGITEVSSSLQGTRIRPVTNGQVTFTNLAITKVLQTVDSTPVQNRDYRLEAFVSILSGNEQTDDRSLGVRPGSAKSMKFECYLPETTTVCVNFDPLTFQRRDDQRYGFRMTARDEYDNVATSYTGNTQLSINDTIDDTAYEYQNDPQFQNGLIVRNDLVFPDYKAGQVYIKVESGNLQQDLAIPKFTVRPGPVFYVVRVHPDGNEGTNPGNRFVVPAAEDPNRYFAVSVQSEKRNPIPLQAICFMTWRNNDDDADITFNTGIDVSNGRSGFLGFTQDVEGPGYGVAASPPFHWNAKEPSKEYSIFAFPVSSGCPPILTSEPANPYARLFIRNP